MRRTPPQESSANVEELAEVGISTWQDDGDRMFITREQQEELKGQAPYRAAMRIKGRGEFFEIKGHSHLVLGFNRGLMSARKPHRQDWELGWSIEKRNDNGTM
jgi:hypothetical protein